jgi:hypothetical protein
VPRKKSEPVEVGLNRVILEPNTHIVHFQGIQWEIQKVVMGAIGGLLFGDDVPQKKAFYKSQTGRRNKEVLLQLASQVYSYLDGTISEFADIDDYVFRVLTSVMVNKVDGSIIGDPVFDVQIYKQFGTVSAKGTEAKEPVGVAFVGKAEDQFVSPAMNKVLLSAAREFKLVKLTSFKDARSAPTSLRSKVTDNRPTLIVGENAFPVGLKSDKDGTNYISIEDGDKEFPVRGVKDAVVFLSKKSGLRPEILSGATAFESVSEVEEEIRLISDMILKNTSKELGEADLIKNLAISEAIENLVESIEPIDQKNLPEDATKEFKGISKELESAKDEYDELKVEYEVSTEELQNLESKFAKEEIKTDDYRVGRMKTQRSRITAREKLIELQIKIKGKLTDRVGLLLEMVKSKEK